MLRFVSLILAAALLAPAALATDTPRLPRKPFNLSSHSPEFFRDLLTGRVWVFKHQGYPAAFHFTADGRAIGCKYNPDGAIFTTPGGYMNWKIGTPNSPSNLEMTTDHWGSGSVLWRMLIVYSPDTGRFHAEQYSRSTQKWRVIWPGWIQDSWPATLRRQCAHMTLPDGLPVNQVQNRLDWEHVKCTAAPVHNHPGSERGYIGATGLAAFGGKPTMTAEQALAVERRMQGVIGRTPRGRRVVGVRTPDRREIWLVDTHDDLIDVGILNQVPGRDIAVIRWKGFTPDYSFRTRYPIPIRPTTRAHPAFEMMIELASAARPVSLDHPAANSAEFVFAPGGRVDAGGASGA